MVHGKKDLHKVVCALVHDCKSACLCVSSRSMLISFFYARSNTRYMCVIVSSKLESLCIDLFELINVVLSIRVPHNHTRIQVLGIHLRRVIE